MCKLQVHPEVAAALQTNRPVVALETAVITAGLPREPLPTDSRFKYPEWNCSNPVNLELAKAMDRAVRQCNATPAWVSILDGEIRIGLDQTDLGRLSVDENAQKASFPDLAGILNDRSTAGTTVSATLYACRMLARHQSDVLPIRVMATGGIGGLHRSWSSILDISADLRQLASTPMCVVCSGPKSVVDVAATYESLESLGCPVISYRTDHLPQFVSSGTESLPARRRIDDLEIVASLCSIHFSGLGSETSVILANTPPAEYAIEANDLDAAIKQAELLALEKRIDGSARTPFLLSQMNRLTNGRFLDANLALLIDNSRVAAKLATALCKGVKSS